MGLCSMLWCRVPPGAWRRLHTRRVGIHRRSTVSLNLNPRALSRIHRITKFTLKRADISRTSRKKLMPPGLHTAMSLFTTGGALHHLNLTDKTDSLWISEMRLRVVPGFISPPPGFGGLGYTPTARACVNISIPLQLRVIDMLDVFTPLLKLFANEPLERLMYTIIIFGLTLWLIPKEFTVAFNAYTEIPWLFQIIVFAFSFVVAISFSRLRAHI